MTVRQELTVFRQQVVCSSNDELRDQTAELFKPLLAGSFLLIRRKSVPSRKNHVLEILPEIVSTAKVAGVGKVEQ